MPRRHIDASSPSQNWAHDDGRNHQLLRGANDNGADRESCVTVENAVLVAPTARFSAAPPPELLRLVEALARQAAANDYHRAKQAIGAED